MLFKMSIRRKGASGWAHLAVLLMWSFTASAVAFAQFGPPPDRLLRLEQRHPWISPDIGFPW